MLVPSCFSEPHAPYYIYFTNSATTILAVVLAVLGVALTASVIIIMTLIVLMRKQGTYCPNGK